MTKLEVAKLALKVSNELYSHFGNKGSVKLMAREYVDAINVILQDYDITAKADSNKRE